MEMTNFIVTMGFPFFFPMQWILFPYHIAVYLQSLFNYSDFFLLFSCLYLFTFYLNCSFKKSYLLNQLTKI